MSHKILAETRPSRVSGSAGTVQWFKSDPLVAIGSFALQLETQSADATKSGQPNIRFEVVVFTNSRDQAPSKTYHSHCNEILSTSGNEVWQFGSIFYPGHPIFQDLKIGNAIGVQIVLSGSGQFSIRLRGRLVTRSLAELLPLTERLNWSLRDSPEEGVYTFESHGYLQVKASGNEPVRNVWFKTPYLSDEIISRLSGVKLFTSAHHQEFISDPSQGIWSWFEIAVFENEKEVTTNLSTSNGTVAVSHKVAVEAVNPRSAQDQEGKLFGREEALLSSLKAGNALGVRVCTQYPGWENHATTGRLVISLSPRKIKPLTPSEEKTKDFTLQLLSMVMSYDKDILKGVLRELEIGVLSKE